MLSVLRKPILVRFTMGTILQNHRATIYSKAPKEKIGPMKSVFALFVFAVTLLAPAGWILHHIPQYRQRSSYTTD